MIATKIIGISGTNGAGKDTVGQILAKYHGYLFISVTDSLRQEAASRGLTVDRSALSTISADWRRQFGLAVLVDKALEAYNRVSDQYQGVCLASLRHPAEVDRIHHLGGIVIWLDAPPQIRYKYILKNLANRQRPAEDNKSYEQFLAEEQTEMHPSGDSATLNMTVVKQQADLTIINDFINKKSLGKLVASKLGLV